MAAQLPESLRREVTRRGEELLARKFVPLLAHETRMPAHEFNHAVAVLCEWRGRCFYLCARYRTARSAEEFIVRTTRMEYAGLVVSARVGVHRRLNCFHLAYFRHTNRWQTVYFGLPLEECFDAIEQQEIFWPLT